MLRCCAAALRDATACGHPLGCDMLVPGILSGAHARFGSGALACAFGLQPWRWGEARRVPCATKLATMGLKPQPRAQRLSTVCLMRRLARRALGLESMPGRLQHFRSSPSQSRVFGPELDASPSPPRPELFRKHEPEAGPKPGPDPLRALAPVHLNHRSGCGWSMPTRLPERAVPLVRVPWGGPRNLHSTQTGRRRPPPPPRPPFWLPWVP